MDWFILVLSLALGSGLALLMSRIGKAIKTPARARADWDKYYRTFAQRLIADHEQGRPLDREEVMSVLMTATYSLSLQPESKHVVHQLAAIARDLSHGEESVSEVAGQAEKILDEQAERPPVNTPC